MLAGPIERNSSDLNSLASSFTDSSLLDLAVPGAVGFAPAARALATDPTSRAQNRTGTTTRAALEIADQVSQLGASLSTNATMDATQVSSVSLRRTFPDLLAVMADVVLNQLWRHTPAQSSFPANMLAIRGGRPETLGLKDIIEAFVKFREEVITRRTKFELNKARDRAHILVGLAIAVANIDDLVALIRKAGYSVTAVE